MGCCVIDCANFRDILTWRIRGPSPSYHRFPVSNDHRAAWIQFAARGRAWQPTTHTCMCSDHFRPEDFKAHHSDSRQKRLKATAIPTIRPFKRIPPEKIIPEKQTLPPHVVARMQKVLQATVKYTDAPTHDGDSDREAQPLSPSPSISELEDDESTDMSVEEQAPPAVEIQFTYTILRSGLALVSLPPEWNVFMDDDDFVMFFRIDKASYELTHAVCVAADLVPTIRIHNLLYTGDEFGHIPLENFWCLKELLLSLSSGTICPGLESNFDGGCALVYKGGAALCPACKARKRRTDQRARNNANKEPEDDSAVRKCSRRKKTHKGRTGIENLDLFLSNDEVNLPDDGIPCDAHKEVSPLEVSKRRRGSAKRTAKPLANFTENLTNSLPVDPWFGIPEQLPVSNTVPSEGMESVADVLMASSDFSAPVPVEEDVIMSNVQRSEPEFGVQECIKTNRNKCHLCDFEGASRSNRLTVHIRRVHPECVAQWTMECVYCGRKCPSERSLKIHVKRMHKDGSLSQSATTDPEAIEAGIEHMKTTGRFSYYCAACHRHYISKPVFDLHQFRHSHPDTSSEQSQRDCPACDFHAPTFPDLVAHMSKHALRHKDSKPCLICGRYIGTLRAHFHDHHPDEMRRIEADWTEHCEECGEKYKWKQMLKFHKKTVHEGFQCLYCAKLFYKTKEFGDHMLEHRVDGVFPCTVCDKKYAVYPALALHYRYYHDITRGQYCAICRKVIPGGERELATHMERCIPGKSRTRGKHREMEAAVKAKYTGAPKGQRLPCDQCGQLLASAASMSKHIRWMHIGDVKKRVAEAKDAKRKQGIPVYKGYVKPRGRVALEDFPHRCEDCQLGYMKEINLIKHRETRHPEKCVDS